MLEREISNSKNNFTEVYNGEDQKATTLSIYFKIPR